MGTSADLNGCPPLHPAGKDSADGREQVVVSCLNWLEGGRGCTLVTPCLRVLNARLLLRPGYVFVAIADRSSTAWIRLT